MTSGFGDRDGVIVTARFGARDAVAVTSGFGDCYAVAVTAGFDVPAVTAGAGLCDRLASSRPGAR